jgi:hypothetical protein
VRARRSDNVATWVSKLSVMRTCVASTRPQAAARILSKTLRPKLCSATRCCADKLGPAESLFSLQIAP